METLPSEMVWEIAQHLSVRDLASCIAVSRWWREVFGSDEVWRSRCDKDSEEHLRTTPCRVEPKFNTPQSDDSTLSPIGRWRTAYLREQHLWKNWAQGNFVEERLDNCSQVVFLNNNFIITVNDDGIVRLINTIENPSVCVATFLSYASGCKVSVIRNDMFIIWDSECDTLINEIQVMQVNWEVFELTVKHSLSLCVEETDLCFSYYDNVNNVLVVFDDYSRLYFWDLDEGTKLKSESIMDDIDGIALFNQPLHDEKCENLGVVGWYFDMNFPCTHYSFFIYSVNNLKFWPFTKKYRGNIWNFAILEQFVFLGYRNCVELHNYQTSQCLQTFNSFVNLNWKGLCSLGNRIILVDSGINIDQLSRSNGVFKRSHIKRVYPDATPVISYVNKKLSAINIGEFTVLITHSSVLLIKLNEFFYWDRTLVNLACSRVGLFSGSSVARFRFYW